MAAIKAFGDFYISIAILASHQATYRQQFDRIIALLSLKAAENVRRINDDQKGHLAASDKCANFPLLKWRKLQLWSGSSEKAKCEHGWHLFARDNRYLVRAQLALRQRSFIATICARIFCLNTIANCIVTTRSIFLVCYWTSAIIHINRAVFFIFI